MALVKLPKMNEEEIKTAIEKDNICRIAFIDNDFPYISPFQYVFHKNTLYFHITDYGKKMKILENKKRNNVCVAIEKFEPDLSYYYFIAIQGRLEKVEDEKQIADITEKMVGEARKKYSTNFLAAHGFDNKKGWEEFSLDKGVKIYKLKEMKRRIGLKGFK
jgi:nitroimidazol reductase NimA-like FMN-containing flavoprotein (pyridoxamine 5'-phosphate oxidase superfamily)